MTKLRLPPWILEIYGSVNKGRIAFRRFRKTIVLEVDPSPSYTRTTAQANVRDTFKQAVQAWNSLTDEEKEQYNREASKYNLTGYQYFISQYMKEHLAPPTELQPAVEVTITEQSGQDLTDYQVLLVVNNDSAFFDAVGTDPTKLEIRAEDKTTLLDFYIEEWDTTNNNAKIWIKIPSIPANGTVKAYIYSNPDRTESLSDPNQVFDFFDDFEGTELDTNKWATGRWAGTESYSVVVNNGYVEIYSGSQTTAGIVSKQAFYLPFIIEGKWKYVSGNQIFTGITHVSGGSDQDWLRVMYDDAEEFRYQKREAGTITTYESISRALPTTMTPFKWIITKTDAYYYENGEQVNTVTTQDRYSTEALYIQLFTWDNGKAQWDMIRVRKYASPEPTVSYTILT